MAFTTAPLPMDKEQGSFWQGNEDLPVTNDNLFDQYVSFETVEPTAFDCGYLGDPPSPSILLDSLDCLTNSSDGQDQPPAHNLVEAATRPGAPIFSAQHVRPVPALYEPPDLALGRGSISDSELLRLEGISLRSPRGSNSAPSSPHLMPSSPLSPRKNRRFIDSVHATVQRVVNRPSAPGQALAVAPPLDIKIEADHHAMIQQPLNVADGLMESAYGPIDCHGLPLSPPLTGELPSASQQQPRGTQFVTGHIEDPFSEGYMVLHPARARPHDEDTPLHTPVFRNDALFRNPSQPIDLAHATFQQHKQRSTSSAEWPVESPAAKDPRAPWAAAGHDGPDARNTRGPGGWDDEADGVPAAGPHGPHALARRIAPPTGLPYEPDGLSGLMIHMPQPRQPHAAAPLLTAAMPAEPLGTPTTPRRPRGLYTDRRPQQPRAPSSGARHHHHHHHHHGHHGHHGAGLTSPRKPSALHHSASRPLLVRREDDPPASPTPTTPSASASRRRSSSMSVRKQRSWSRREPRTPNPSTASAACSPGLGGGVDFVNFTPSDKKVLMHGVAPSGSSKTKARREKEALDRRRKLSEAAYKAVQAAGGDIERLRAEVSGI